ncbi:hypothetical protein [Eubacterium sp. AF15-50]|uniref:hypothetical protein n=1 Tax=Eubacterium sp. AF15-50 TaxID=2293103 RepID=UPI002673E695|nr:hypothetical protein [Eubacterium sp. AF15-50]
MKTWKLVSGILSIVMFALVALQSCAVGIGNALEDNDEVSGSAGLIVAVLLLAGGITSVSVRNAKTNGGNIALIVLFGIAVLFGFVFADSYTDLKVWASWCLICLILAVVSLFKNKKNKQKIEDIKE